MPVIKAWCLPHPSLQELSDFRHLLINAAESIPELKLKGQDAVTVIFPHSASFGFTRGIIVEVTGLFEQPERTPEVCQVLANNIGFMTSKMFPTAKVECFISLFNPINGFWSSD